MKIIDLKVKHLLDKNIDTLKNERNEIGETPHGDKEMALIGEMCSSTDIFQMECSLIVDNDLNEPKSSVNKNLKSIWENIHNAYRKL